MESLNGKLSDELLNREAFETLMGKWRREHNQRWERSRAGIRWPGNRGRPNRSPEFQLGPGYPVARPAVPGCPDRHAETT